ncbi:MAG: VOC family protein [Corynebacterium sp.]|nr:VOC family protein [Corynebacterium sp.]
MPAFMAENGLPLWNEIAVSDMDRAQQFYKEVFGWEFKNPTADPNYFFAHAQGMPIASLVNVDKIGGLISYFATSDLDKDLKTAQDLGASLVYEPADFVRGRAAALLDPSGALFGLMQPREEEDFVGAGEPGTPVWYEHYSKTPMGDFYSELLNWDCESPTGDYIVASRDGGAFAGMLINEGVAGSVWFPYFGVERIDAAINAATLAGGSVVKDPEVNEFGIVASIADPDGTVLIICEVAPWEEDPHEGASVLDLED